MVEMRSRYASGSAPVLVRLLPDGRDRGGRGPVLLPVLAGVVGPLFDEPGGVRPRRAGGAPARARRARTSTSAAARGSTRAGSGRSTGASGTFRAASSRASSSRPSACASMPRPSRRCAAISRSTSSPPRSSGGSCSHKTPEHFQFAFKVPEQITCKVFPTHARYGPQAGTGERGVPGRAHVAARCSCARCCRTGTRRRC